MNDRSDEPYLLLRSPSLTQSGSPVAGIGAARPAFQAAAVPRRQRARLWQLPASMHCSIIGTCLTTADLRRAIRTITGDDCKGLSELQVHEQGVRLAHDGQAGGKALHRFLDDRHRVTLKRFDKAGDAAAVAALWEAAKAEGDIPGAYWALVTHWATDGLLSKQAFGDVHMLSHLVGAANRADIRRLNELAARLAEALLRGERQQAWIQALSAERDELNRRFEKLMLERVQAEVAAGAGNGIDEETGGPVEAGLPLPGREAADVPAGTGAVIEAGASAAVGASAKAGISAGAGAPMRSPADADDERQALRALVQSLSCRLEHETNRRRRMEQQSVEQRAALTRAQRSVQELVHRESRLEEELHALAARWQQTADPARAADADRLAGRTLLYVGGRPGQIAQLRALVEQQGGRLIHHDGGVEGRSGLLPGLVSRADLVAFPVDCISHEATGILKRTCRHAGKPCLALRSAGLGSLALLLERLDTAGTENAAVVQGADG